MAALPGPSRGWHRLHAGLPFKGLCMTFPKCGKCLINVAQEGSSPSDTREGIALCHTSEGFFRYYLGELVPPLRR
jgi:hypothetical protein